jgi:uncharacterized protein (UPF0305 family)
MNLPEKYASGTGYSQVLGPLKKINKKGALGQALAHEAENFSIVDIQWIGAGLAKSLNITPSPYKEKVTPYFMEQYFGQYYRLIRMNDSGAFKDLRDEIKEKKLYIDYCDTIEMTLRDWEAHGSVYEYNPQYQLAQYGLYYFIVNCFAMFVLEEPGHPVGMPFPGGFKVENREGI